MFRALQFVMSLPQTVWQRGKIVMGERPALAAPRMVFSCRVDSAAKSEARFDIYVWKESSERVCKVRVDRRLWAVQWYDITDVSFLSVPALTGGLTHFRQHWLDYPKLQIFSFVLLVTGCLYSTVSTILISAWRFVQFYFYYFLAYYDLNPPLLHSLQSTCCLFSFASGLQR